VVEDQGNHKGIESGVGHLFPSGDQSILSVCSWCCHVGEISGGGCNYRVWGAVDTHVEEGAG
jgi:hypothetical protein